MRENDKADSNLESTVAEFVGWFEEVFDHDWQHTIRCLMVDCLEDGPDVFLAEDGTFLRPNVEDEFGNNWVNRGNLLSSYRRLRTRLEGSGVEIPRH